MARLRQQYPQNYRSSGNISTEFESVIRYLNAAELGNHTIGELLAVLFDRDGVFRGPVELRRNLDGTIQYRVGTYADVETGWHDLLRADELRGAPGIEAGTIGEPILHTRYDVVPDAGAKKIAYAHDESDALLVFIDGILQRGGDSAVYGSDAAFSAIDFVVPFDGAQTVTIYKVRTAAISGYVRRDFEVTAARDVFPFVHDSQAKLSVYLNGILLREGGNYDYVTSPAAGIVAFNHPVAAGSIVTVIVIENITAQTVSGLMLESRFTDQATGLIRLDQISVPDESLPQVKIAGLREVIRTAARIVASPTAPDRPVTADLWLDSSIIPSRLKVFDGVDWILASPDSVLPGFKANNAGQVLHVNGTGTGLEFRAVNLSNVLLRNLLGAANGVASLDSRGRLPAAQLPEVLGSESIYFASDGPVADGDRTIKRIYGQRVRIRGLSATLFGGNCTAQLIINGVPTGPVISVSSASNEQEFGAPIEIDSTQTAVSLGVRIGAVKSADRLEISLSAGVIADGSRIAGRL